MADVNPLSLALDSGTELSEIISSIQVCLIFFSGWLFTLGWDIFYYALWDFELVLSQGWSSPIRALTRISYFFSRILGLAALLLALLFWAEGWSEAACRNLPFIYEALLVLSYGFTMVILAFRTLSLYPGDSKFDRGVQWGTALGLLNNAIWLGIHVKEADGHRMPGTNSRCAYVEDELGLFLIRGALLSTVIFNTAMLFLTLYKVYISGSHHFFNRTTIIGRLLISSKSSVNGQPEPAGNRLAVSLISQGLIAFFYLLVVDIIALVCCIALTTDLYRQMVVISMGAFSSLLASSVFRETFRATGAMAATHQLELKLMEARFQSPEKREDPYRDRTESSSRSNHGLGEETEMMENSFECRTQSEERSVAHPNWNSDALSSVENLNTDGESIIPRSSFESKGYDSPGPNSSFEQVPQLNESHPYAPYSQTDKSKLIVQSSLMSGLSFHAFDNGPTRPHSRNDSEDSNTLGQVSILGSALPSWAQANAQNFSSSNRFGSQVIEERARSRFREGRRDDEEIEMGGGLLPPKRAARRDSRHRRHHHHQPR